MIYYTDILLMKYYSASKILQEVNQTLRTFCLRWIPMVLFSYNWIYRDETLSARITRGMFVDCYNKIFHIQS